ncbi:armadillo-type protein [Mycena latifolia]|nr:armadillo-type protein [Mycena latifolia]
MFVNSCRVFTPHPRDGFVFEAALGALIRIAHWPGGAEAAVAAKVLDNCAEWLGSPADWVRRSAVRLLGKLAKHEGTTGAVLQIAPCEQLVTLLSDSDYSLVANAAFDVLSSIANTADGAQAAVAAKVLKHVTHRLISSVPQIRVSACELLVKLARHQSTAAAVLDIKPCERLVALLIDGDVAAEAFHALCSIANSRDGAEAVVEAKVRDHLAEGVVSHVPDIQGAAWTLLRRLQAHESTAAAVLAITPCERLVTLLSDSDGWVVIDAFGRLSDIAKSPEGAEATVTAKALDQVVEHLVSPVSVVRAPATELLLRLAGHSSTIQEVVRVYPNVVSLVKYRKHLLGTQDTINDMARHPGHRWGEVGERAMWALDDYLARSQAGINLGAN